jgi:hypothetical protein
MQAGVLQMRIKWKNIGLLLLIIILVAVIINPPYSLQALIHNLGTMHPRKGEQLEDIIALGIICITALGIVIILCNRR